MTVSAWRSWASTTGAFQAFGPETGLISELALDSRALDRGDLDGEQAIFFAIRGEWHDGHAYLHDAHGHGVRRFVVSEPVELPDSDVVVVENPVAALQALARQHRMETGVPLVAITGSNGKTIVKEWVAALLARKKRVYKSPRSFNSQVGVPLSVWGLSADQELGVVEVGISEPGEMAPLREVTDPRWGVLTHLGEAHAANFPSYEALIAEKLKLFDKCQWVALPADCRAGVEGLERLGVALRTWGETGDLQVIRRWQSGEVAEVEIAFEGKQAKCILPAPGELSFRNAMTAALTALCLGASLEDIADTMPFLPQVDRRMQRLSGPSGTWVISDAYANDWGALAFALRDLARLPTTHPRALILGSLPGTEHDPTRLERLLEGTGVEKVWLVGKEWSETTAFRDWSVFSSPDLALIQFQKSNPFHGMDVLVKGPRTDAFEQFIPLLTSKGHVTSLTLDLDAVGENVRAFRHHIRNSKTAVPIDHPTRLIAVVKASGYGANGPALARHLEQLGMSHLAVACTEEGVELRRQGIALPILVLNPDPSTFDALIAHRLEPELIGPKHFNSFCSALEGQDTWPVHIKVDTGMHRVGFDLTELPALTQALKEPECPVRAETVMSHLASADQPEADAFTQKQFHRFHEAADLLRQGTSRNQHPLGRHLVNSAGLVRFPEQALEFARLGIGLFGVSEGVHGLPLQPALSFETTISQIRNVPAGEGVGYGATDVSDAARTIAVLPVGYADGYPRHLSNGKGWVGIHNRLVPVVGRVCMDMTLIDVTELPNATEGDPVVLFGESPTLESVAAAADTIPYELIARIPARVARIHRGG